MVDREYFFIAFAISSAISIVVARLLLARVQASELFRSSDRDRRSKLYLMAAVVFVLWVAVILLFQIVSASSVAVMQWFVFSFDATDPFATSARIRALSIGSGITTGTQLGLALGLVGYVIRALGQIRRTAIEEGATASALPEDPDWSRPSEG